MKAWGRNPQQFNPNTVQMNRSGKNSKSKDHLLVKVCFFDILFRGFGAAVIGVSLLESVELYSFEWMFEQILTCV